MNDEKFKIFQKNLRIYSNKYKINKTEQIKKESNIFFNIAIDFITIPLISTYIGYNIDKYFSLSPIFLLICLCFGIISSIINGIKKLKNYK